MLQVKLQQYDRGAMFLKEKLHYLGAKLHRWSEDTVRQAILWQSKPPCSYGMMRQSGCLALSSRTMKRCVGSCKEQIVSSLIEQGLHQEASPFSQRTPRGYYFTRSTTGEQLHHFTINVIKSEESPGFQVVRLVTDNHSTNCEMFSTLRNGCHGWKITFRLFPLPGKKWQLGFTSVKTYEALQIKALSTVQFTKFVLTCGFV